MNASRCFARFLLVFTLTCAAVEAHGQCSQCTPTLKSGWTANTFSVAFASSGFGSADQNAIISAMNYWNSGGAIFQYVGYGPAQITLVIDPALRGTNVVAQRDVTAPNSGSTIRFNPDFLNTSNSTDFLQHVAEHELGHATGFDDLWPPASCSGISVMWHELSASGPLITSPSSCDVTAMNNIQPRQSSSNDLDPFARCGADSSGCAEPILINVSGGPWRLSGLEDPVSFDINATGTRMTIGWTARDSSVAFLALDRNGNGAIDDGSELFGNAAVLHNGFRAANGFVALADLDDNHDDRLDVRDSAWSLLLLWIDRNHDGISQPSELQPVDSSSVTSLDIHYRLVARRDAKTGNTYRFQAFINQNDRRSPYYDVFFAVRR